VAVSFQVVVSFQMVATVCRAGFEVANFLVAFPMVSKPEMAEAEQAMEYHRKPDSRQVQWWGTTVNWDAADGAAVGRTVTVQGGIRPIEEVSER
jgi:hypothetical protein